MPPTICLIRHAEALHNVDSPHNFHLLDPELSELGVRQSKDLGGHLQQRGSFAHDIQLIVVSPFRRTLQTATLSLDWLIQRGVPVVPRAEWQENSDKPCDTGTAVSIISKEFPTIDFSSVDPRYPAKTGRYAYTEEAVLQRGEDCLKWLRDRPESHIAVVTHSAFLRTAVAQRRFANADYRLFQFSDTPNSLDLVELSGEAGGMGKSVVGHMGIEPGDFDE